MKGWRPEVSGDDAPMYERLVAALERDVREGRLVPGDRLPPQRDLAHRLALSVGTVSRAYVEAERRGFISSHVGRGSFVADRARPQSPSEAGGPLDMARNIPPLAPAARWIGEGLSRVRQRADLATAVNYAPPEGLESIREAGASWLSRRHGVQRATRDRVIQCNGGQHGLALAFAALARPGDTILCEAATYPGIRTLADHAGYRLRGVAMDQRGLEPEALARAARETGARVVVLIPTLQNPTTITLDAARRAEIIEVARAQDLMIVEDDAYRVFADRDAPESFADLAPERTLMVAAVSKAVAPGLRLGFLLPPEDGGIRDRLLLGVRAFGYTPPSLGGLVFSQWEQDSTADRIADELIAETDVRTQLARDILGKAMAVPGASRSLHVWMPMPMLDAERLSARALRAGIALTPPDAPAVDPCAPSGVRLCLGAIPSRDRLEQALHEVVEMLTPAGDSAARGLV
ncbi:MULTISPECIES: PLP-dependent aminotransferase family protein [Sphingobium]|uniref:aminotransferase-like domain-containing protein n=1 Tax=Sphingobium TaxID=165695 RepID=UPI0015EB8C8B|nr:MULTISPECIES: PLP-dependent aminotransferase family protein [Sphingobium]MCW2361907.1 DNA-binding transcriptional MocR family regulator [Sphingobium sp. B10D3B]MCW2401414.1 DNA-binding transcriptional MocR family regulator [Sphingobium sp. B10D7B]MCW2408394.1 DNA-binding transcriptional MocR family regulator [Sphingobium xanthum]